MKSLDFASSFSLLMSHMAIVLHGFTPFIFSPFPLLGSGSSSGKIRGRQLANS